MAKVLHFEACPRCRDRGRDRAGDNLAVYSDKSVHCFSCGYHRNVIGFKPKEKVNGDENKAVLPSDFTREVPAHGWQWLLQYGLSYSYWKPFVGYSESHQRLLFIVGQPTRISIGRYIGKDANERAKVDQTFRKWRIWGNRQGMVELLGPTHTGPVVLVEDIISAHKVAQVATCIPLFGTKIPGETINILMQLQRPVVVWLDKDQYQLLPPKLNRLQTFLTKDISYLSTDKDPKEYSIDQIKEFV